MRKFYCLLLLAFMLLFSCSKDNSADAHGSFSATEITLSSQVSGTVMHINAREGDTVKTGDLIAVIDTTDYALSLQEIDKSLLILTAKNNSAKQQIELLEIKQKSLEKDKDRFENLMQQEAASQKQLDDIITSLLIIGKEIDQARTSLNIQQKELELNLIKKEKAELMFDRCFIQVPVNSTVLDIYVNEGELLMPGRPVLKLADLNIMNAVFYISGPQLAQLEYGKQVKIFIDDSMDLKEYKGNISFISSQAEFTPKTIQTRDERTKLVYRVEAAVENDGSLKIGMPLEVRF